MDSRTCHHAGVRIEFYFDFSCPYAYIASTEIEAIAADSASPNTQLVWRPMLLGGVFRGTGLDRSPMEAMGPAKARHNRLDMHRWAEWYGVPLRMPRAHPMRTLRPLRALLSLPESAWPPVIHGFYRAYWQEGRDVTNPDTVRAVLAEAGLSGQAVERAVAANQDPAIRAELHRRTDEAVARGVFGAPTIFLHLPGAGQPLMLWGQDRLHRVRAVLAGWIPGQGNAPDRDGREIGAVPQAGKPATDSASPGRDGSAGRVSGPRIETASHSPGEQPGGAGRTLHFWYDFSSPFAYLGSTQIEHIARRSGAELVWRPMLLGAVFKQVAMANVPLFAMVEAKRAYIRRDLDRWASYWGVPFSFATQFPQKTVTALRLALLAGDRIAPLSHALFRAMWVEDGDLDDLETLAGILAAHGFDADHMLARTRDPAVKQKLIDNTAEAVACGVFGAPTSIVIDSRGDLLFWGQDRLGLVDAALRGWRPDQVDQQISDT